MLGNDDEEKADFQGYHKLQLADLTTALVREDGHMH